MENAEFVWSIVPSMPNLTVKELDVFNFPIQCQYIDNMNISHQCTIQITPLENNPSTITIQNGSTAGISGHYGAQFNDVIRVMLADYSNVEFDTLHSEPIGMSVWDKLTQTDYSELVGFRPDSVRDKWYTYSAKATYNNIHETVVYVIRLYDPNWEHGKNLFKGIVNASYS